MIPSERIQMQKKKKEYILQIPFIQTSRQCKLINNDKKPLRGGPGTRRVDDKGHAETFTGAGYIQNLSGDSLMEVFIW